MSSRIIGMVFDRSTTPRMKLAAGQATMTCIAPVRPYSTALETSSVRIRSASSISSSCPQVASAGRANSRATAALSGVRGRVSE